MLALLLLVKMGTCMSIIMILILSSYSSMWMILLLLVIILALLQLLLLLWVNNLILRTWADCITSWGFRLIILLLGYLFIRKTIHLIFFTSFPCLIANLAKPFVLLMLIFLPMTILSYPIPMSIRVWWGLYNILLSPGLIYPLLCGKLASS